MVVRSFGGIPEMPDMKPSWQVSLADMPETNIRYLGRVISVAVQNGEIKLCNIRPEVAKTFNMIGVGSLMQSYRSEEEALKSFAA